MLGRRRFSVAAPPVWNSLPLGLKTNCDSLRLSPLCSSPYLARGLGSETLAERTNKFFGSTPGSVDLVINLPLAGFNVIDLVTKLLSSRFDEIVDVLAIMVAM